MLKFSIFWTDYNNEVFYSSCLIQCIPNIHVLKLKLYFIFKLRYITVVYSVFCLSAVKLVCLLKNFYQKEMIKYKKIKYNSQSFGKLWTSRRNFWDDFGDKAWVVWMYVKRNYCLIVWNKVLISPNNSKIEFLRNRFRYIWIAETITTLSKEPLYIRRLSVCPYTSLRTRHETCIQSVWKDRDIP
jgi:hypothetical protein